MSAYGVSPSSYLGWPLSFLRPCPACTPVGVTELCPPEVVVEIRHVAVVVERHQQLSAVTRRGIRNVPMKVQPAVTLSCALASRAPHCRHHVTIARIRELTVRFKAEPSVSVDIGRVRGLQVGREVFGVDERKVVSQ